VRPNIIVTSLEGRTGDGVCVRERERERESARGRGASYYYYYIIGGKVRGGCVCVRERERERERESMYAEPVGERRGPNPYGSA